MQCILCKKNIPDATDVCPYCELPNYMFMYPNLFEVNDKEKERINGIIKRYYDKSDKGSNTVNTDKKQTSASSDTSKKTSTSYANRSTTKNTNRTDNNKANHTRYTNTESSRNPGVTVNTEKNMFIPVLIIGAIMFFAGLITPDDTGLLLTVFGLLVAVFGLLGRKVCSFLGIIGYMMISAGVLGEIFSTDQTLSGDFSRVLLAGIVVMVVGIVLKGKRK